MVAKEVHAGAASLIIGSRHSDTTVPGHTITPFDNCETAESISNVYPDDRNGAEETGIKESRMSPTVYWMSGGNLQNAAIFNEFSSSGRYSRYSSEPEGRN
jgi:hypothetical protein